MGKRDEHEKTRAAAAPRKPKKGAVSSPLNTDDILVSGFLLLCVPLSGGLPCSVYGRPRRWGEEERKGSWVGRQDAISLEPSLVSFCCDYPSHSPI
jgi:hypothetical protein